MVLKSCLYIRKDINYARKTPWDTHMTPSKKVASETCWEFMNCPLDIRKECIVYKKNAVNPCWVLNKLVVTEGCGVLPTCKNCPWFLKNNPSFNKEYLNSEP
jgi:hypothetical protein